MAGIISAIKPHSIAADLNIMPGDTLCAVNGQPVKDIIELSYLLAENTVKLTLKDKHGQEKEVLVKKSVDEDLGLEFASAVFDKVMLCHNKCVFCFVDQMMPGLRKGLYVRDDDYRLSFLYGNFITLTNLKDEDYERIIKTHLSPLYVSVHAVSGTVRKEMMKNKDADKLLANIKRLCDAGIELHAQIVLCPGYNDGEVLEETYKELRKLYPMVKTMAVVPVGITKNRENLPKLRLFTPKECGNIVSAVSKWQQDNRAQTGESFIYLGDEFYVACNKDFPPEEEYDGFPQIENGIGLSRAFISDWHKSKAPVNGSVDPAVILVGESAAKVLKPLIAKFNTQNKTKHILLPVINHFFGETINVTGLLTASDITLALKSLKTMPKKILLPDIIINNDDLFLDDVSFTDFAKSFDGNVKRIASAKELKNELSK